MGRRKRKTSNSIGHTKEQNVAAEESQHREAREEEQEIDGDTVKRRGGRPKKARGKKQEVGAAAAAESSDESEREGKARTELEAAEGMPCRSTSRQQPVDGNHKREVGRPKKLKTVSPVTSPLNPSPDKQGFKNAIGPERRKSAKSCGETEEVGTTTEGKWHGRNEQQQQQPGDDHTVTRKKGRPKKPNGKREEGKAAYESEKPEGAGNELEPAERKQSLRLHVQLCRDDNHKRRRCRLQESVKAENELEAANAMQSRPSVGDAPADENHKRKLGRRKKLKNESEETEAAGRDAAGNGVRQVTGQRKSSRIKAGGEQKPASRKTFSKDRKKEDTKRSASATKTAKKQYVSKIDCDGIEFQVGDDVYVKKSEDNVLESDTEVEDCRICGTINEETMLECDDCLAGFHLTCLSPPLETVPEDDWICPYCEEGKSPPVPPSSLRRHRSARERLLALELWAARIERIWRAADGTVWFSAHWFLVPEETAPGRQLHNGKRELFRSSQSDDNEINSILRHCYVMSLKDYKNSSGEGDDVFFCEYEYNEQWCKFKRIEYLDDDENWSEDDQSFQLSDEFEEEGNADDSDGRKRRRSVLGKRIQPSKSTKAANKRHNYSKGIEEVGARTIPDGVRKRPQTEFYRAKAALALSALPPSLPCRDSERKEITAFLRESVRAGQHCLGRCLYISGVPGTGKTATVLEVIKELGSKVELGEVPPYRFVEINGLRLPSPEHAYTILHEALTGQHVGWKRALQHLDERFSKADPGKGVDARPTVLLVDELDLLVTRNQSVLYNIFDWPSRPHSRLVIIGIANTMDLPERMLPRIASRMGMHRISFTPYSHKQLEAIISTRLKGVQVFNREAAEFASRKVAAVSGDVRRALELCRRAVEIAEARNGKSVVLADVDAAISEIFDAPQIQMMKRSAKLAKVFLVAMVHEQRRTALAETTFEKIAIACSELCTNNGEERPNWDTLLAVGCKLGASRLLLCETGAQHRLQKLQLNFPCDDVSFALKKDEECPWLAKYL